MAQLACCPAHCVSRSVTGCIDSHTRLVHPSWLLVATTALVSYLDASAAQRKKPPTVAFPAMQSLMARSPVARFWRAYETALKHQPLAVQSATAGVLWGAGDVLAQKLSDRERGMSKPLDLRHSALTSLFGAAVIGPLGSAWYAWLEAACTFGQPCSLPVLAAKVLADATVWNAFNISSFFLWNELLLESGDIDYAVSFAVRYMSCGAQIPSDTAATSSMGRGRGNARDVAHRAKETRLAIFVRGHMWQYASKDSNGLR
ncbi:uncharacterized protein HaLaN_09449 [Haematococcus lacustris]|uniref:Protein Mpv17 n=1 Tax=Haematococcus lacustris TaxID=44745 RepID=A0A699YTK2_HAELA|nr:uncharacterized protein HaLaN_09449 [Haematococcus lacustris]